MSKLRQRAAVARGITGFALMSVISACVTATQPPDDSPMAALRGNGLAPPGAPAGSCWGKVETPAVIETVSEQVLVSPAQTNPDGTVAQLPVYRAENRQQIVTPRGERWFETPCPPSFTVEFVSSLQRALIARGLYAGPVNGSMDGPTRAAVLDVQREGGLESDVLSMETARELGLVVAVLPAG